MGYIYIYICYARVESYCLARVPLFKSAKAIISRHEMVDFFTAKRKTNFSPLY